MAKKRSVLITCPHCKKRVNHLVRVDCSVTFYRVSINQYGWDTEEEEFDTDTPGAFKNLLNEIDNIFNGLRCPKCKSKIDVDDMEQYVKRLERGEGI